MTFKPHLEPWKKEQTREVKGYTQHPMIKAKTDQPVSPHCEMSPPSRKYGEQWSFLEPVLDKSESPTDSLVFMVPYC